jgi:hypothetical protein
MHMQKRMGILAATFLAFALLATQASCRQDKGSRPSPPAQTKCELSGGKSVTIDYSSPRVKGRKIFGELVPYGKVWRAGANEATTFVTDTDLDVGGTHVPAGSYTLFVVPDQNSWKLVISKKTGEWGTAYAGPSEDLARIDMKAGKTPAFVENFIIAFDHSGNGCTLHMDWENTRASVQISAK